MLPPQVIVGFCMYGGVVLLAVLAAVAFVKLYVDSYEENSLLSVISVICMTLAICVLMLVPVDVLSTSFRDDSSPARNLLLETLYFFFFLAMMLLVFCGVPFCYFFYEEGAESSFGRRVWAGVKYSAAFAVVFVVLLILGFVLRGTLETEHKEVLGDLDVVEFAVNFMVACAAILGLLVWFTYSAFGLSWLGISFLKGRPIDTMVEAEDLEREISIAREQRRYLRSKKLTGRSARHDGEAVEQVGLLQHKERVLRQRQERLGRIGSCYKRCMIVIRPATLIVGIALLLFSALIVLSLLLSSIDKLSPYALSYVMGYPVIFNPIDLLLSVCVQLFPLDYLIFTLIVVYIAMATISGISRAGIRLLWIELFPIKRQRSAPQGVLLATQLMMLFVISLVFVMDTLAPRYLMFGGQTYLTVNNTVAPCSVLAPVSANCSVTQIERIVTDVKFRFGFFSVVFYWSNWAFLAFFVAGVVFSICLQVRRHHSQDADDSD